MTASEPDDRQRDKLDVVAMLRRLVEQGDALPAERRLSERLGVNRYAIRQAMQVLRETNEMPVDARNRQTVWRAEKVLQHTNPSELWEMRMLFEPQVARLAALRATPAEIQTIADIHARTTADVFDQPLDIAFHRAIGVASHNALAAYFIELITDLTLDEGFRMKYPPLTTETGHGHHAALLAAIQKRDAEAAEAMMFQHVRAINVWIGGFAASFKD